MSATNNTPEPYNFEEDVVMSIAVTVLMIFAGAVVNAVVEFVKM